MLCQTVFFFDHQDRLVGKFLLSRKAVASPTIPPPITQKSVVVIQRKEITIDLLHGQKKFHAYKITNFFPIRYSTFRVLGYISLPFLVIVSPFSFTMTKDGMPRTSYFLLKLFSCITAMGDGIPFHLVFLHVGQLVLG